MKSNWRKSSHSNAEGNCVEVANHDNTVMVRDTKSRERSHLAVELDAWRNFVTELKTTNLPDSTRASVIGG